MEIRNNTELSPLKKEGNDLSYVVSGLHLNCSMCLMMGGIEIFLDKPIDIGHMNCHFLFIVVIKYHCFSE